MNFNQNEYEIKEKIKAILVGLVTEKDDIEEEEKSLCELERLLDTAGGELFCTVVQNKSKPDPRTLIGSGKVQEISELCGNNEIGLVIFNTDLSPSQIRNLENEIGHDVSVIDRSMLILDIFALHAVSGEGKLQVELAQLKYTAPRLMGKGNEMSRLGGGIGTRGPGESKLESDRRHLKRRVMALEEEIKLIEKNRKSMRASRDRSGLTKVAIVGYTNAGKSTLLNTLTGAGILAEDKLFATLDPTTRKFSLPGGEQVLLTDTVGFIKRLPHHLVRAFRSTLDEAVYADIILIVIDASDDEYMSQLECTEKTLEELGVSDKPVLYVFNKCDIAADSTQSLPVRSERDRVISISAKNGQGCEQLAQYLEEMVHERSQVVKFVIPNSEQSALNILYKNATVKNVEYGDENVEVRAVVDEKTRGMLRKYDVDYIEIKEDWM